MKTIEVKVHIRDGEEPHAITISEDATIDELLRMISPDHHENLYLVVEDEKEPRHRQHRLHECGIRHGHQLHCHPKEIHYTVDGEDQKSDRHLLTAEQIMVKAGVDPKTHYLIRLLPGGGEYSYKDNPSAEIHLHDGMAFLAALVGSAPLS